MASTGNTGTTGQSAASAQAAAAAGNAAASNAANGNTGTGSGNTSGTTGSTTSTNTSTSNTSNGATNSAGLMGSLIGFGNAVAKGEVGNGGGGSGSGNKTYSEVAKEMGYSEKDIARNDKMQSFIANIFTNAEDARNSLSAEQVARGDEAYTKARAEGKTEAEAQFAARDAMRGIITNGASIPGFKNSYTIGAFKAKNTGPTYNPATTAMANTNKTIAKGSSEMGPSTPATTPAANNAPGGNLGGETGGIVSGAAPTNTSDAANTGVTYRGGTVTTPSGTSVTDSGTGGSISSMPSRDASSIGLGVYNADRANYDQDNWNRGMEAESSSLVSDEECKAFAKRAFMENSEPFKKVRVTICEKC